MRALPVTAAALLIAALIAIAPACGPIEYVNQVSRRAAAQVEAAAAVRADKHAPYWYTLAVEYLHKAREEAAHADYQAANRFGKRAGEAANRAIEITLSRTSGAEVAPSGDSGEGEPAGEGGATETLQVEFEDGGADAGDENPLGDDPGVEDPP